MRQAALKVRLEVNAGEAVAGSIGTGRQRFLAFVQKFDARSNSFPSM
ncbi:MAG: hypothetical protein JWQ71_4844, partial [Pedosphaera sp.]|nr:hypothetical protein [Pedosphaera sp.]